MSSSRSPLDSSLSSPRSSLSSPRSSLSSPRRRGSIQKLYYVYILASKKNGTLYVGVTSDLFKRIWEHKNNLIDGFTKKYNIHTLVWYEFTENVEAAIKREKQIKKWNRAWKINLINEENPNWKDLYSKLI